VVTLDDFRIKIKRSMALQASYNDNHLRDVGQRLEREARAQFQILLDPAECLHLLIEKELGGADVSESCQVNDRAPCCNCRRRWECVEQKHRLIAILESGAPSKEKSKARTELKKMLTVRNELKSHTIGIGGWTEDRIVSGKKMIVLCRNEEVTKLLQKLIKKILRTHRYGLPLAKLTKEVEMGTGRRGLKSVETRWCLTWFLVHGVLEEELDRSPDPIGFARVEKAKVHTNLSAMGLILEEWPVVPIHERLGDF
tara:strand:+ start:63 stop:827 length:765 start_codon:yes stop_codon:yes gene_type:complete